MILLFNLIFRPGFFDVSIVEGRLHGLPIFILKNGASIMLIAIGMTLVIATGGVDLSVGAVMALAGSVASYLVVQKAVNARRRSRRRWRCRCWRDSGTESWWRCWNFSRS